MKQIFVVAAMFGMIHGWAQTDTAIKKVLLPTGYAEKTDVVYSEINGWEGKEDIYYNPTATKPTAVMLNIHGGGWNHGTKESQNGGFSQFFKMGFAVVNIEYRLTPQATAPAAIEDVRCALLYVVAHAKELNIDVNRIVVSGTSAGAHLALMAGLLQNDPRFDSHCSKGEPFTIAAIIDQYGIADVWDWAYGPYIRSKSATSWLGINARDSMFAATVSPISYVKKTSPGTFIVHGDADPVVPYQESIILFKKLQEVGVATQFFSVPGGKHGGFEADKKKEINTAIEAFLRKIGVLDNSYIKR